MRVGFWESETFPDQRFQIGKTGDPGFLSTPLREVVEVIFKGAPHFASLPAAYAWYRAQPLPGFDNQTAMQIVNDGFITDVLHYLHAEGSGAYS